MNKVCVVLYVILGGRHLQKLADEKLPVTNERMLQTLVEVVG